jgi:hypothetical protein
MSSWIVAKNRPKKKVAEITKYYDTSLSPDTFTMYMEYIAAYIYSQKLGETSNVWDPTEIIKNTLRTNPQVRLLRELPENESAQKTTASDYKPLVGPMKLPDVQKFASNIMIYADAVNQAVVRNLDKAGIKSIFDIGIHLVKDPSGPDINLLRQYTSLIKAYQTKSKKTTLQVYIMADNYSVVTQFQVYCDPSWKLTSLSKIPLKDGQGDLVNSMSEIQIMSALPALILDFDRISDRFIYLMYRNLRNLTYFVELNGKQWSLLNQ